MIIRYSKPAKTNKYYIRKADGGYNTAIYPDNADANLTALPNCVGYAVGRFAEMGGTSECVLPPVQASSMIKYATKAGLKYGKKPQLGGCLVFSGGNDGCGHVMMVEQVRKDGSLLVTDSTYGKVVFRSRVVSPNANYGMPSNYCYLGCVYNNGLNMAQVLKLRQLLLTGKTTKSYDYNGDGTVDMKDLLLLRKAILNG